MGAAYVYKASCSISRCDQCNYCEKQLLNWHTYKYPAIRMNHFALTCIVIGSHSPSSYQYIERRIICWTVYDARRYHIHRPNCEPSLLLEKLSVSHVATYIACNTWKRGWECSMDVCISKNSSNYVDLSECFHRLHCWELLEALAFWWACLSAHITCKNLGVFLARMMVLMCHNSHMTSRWTHTWQSVCWGKRISNTWEGNVVPRMEVTIC